MHRVVVPFRCAVQSFNFDNVGAHIREDLCPHRPTHLDSVCPYTGKHICEQPIRLKQHFCDSTDHVSEDYSDATFNLDPLKRPQEIFGCVTSLIVDIIQLESNYTKFMYCKWRPFLISTIV